MGAVLTAYYNEHDKYAAQWLRNLIKAGHIADGYVDDRSILDVTPNDLAGFTQCHFFAGIGVWSLALRRAGWSDDKPVWTGSCPCQPFSAAGKEMGLLMSGIYGQRGSSSSHKSYLQQFLVSKLRQKTDSLGSTLYTMTWKGRTTPSGRTILALRASARRTSDKDFTSWPTPQAIDASGLARPPRFKTDIPRDPNNAGSWRTDLKDAPYLVNSMPQEGWRSPSASDGEGGIMEIRAGTTGRYKLRDEAPLASGWPTTTTRDGKGGYQGGRIRDGKVSTDTLDVTAQLSGWPTPQLMDFRSDTRVQGEHSDKAKAGGMLESEGTDFGDRLDYPDATNGLWRDADWLSCRDGKWRAVMPGAFPLVNGAPARVGRLRAYGNALCSAQAQGFIESFMEYKNESRS